MAATTAAPSLPLPRPTSSSRTGAGIPADQHAVWAELVGRRMPQLKSMPARSTSTAFTTSGLRQDVIPDLAMVNTLLAPRTG